MLLWAMQDLNELPEGHSLPREDGVGIREVSFSPHNYQIKICKHF